MNPRAVPEYAKEKVDRILESIADGRSLRASSKENDVPAPTFLSWVDGDETLRERYARARISQAEVHADDIVTTADRDDLDPKDKAVRVDARKWVASKLHPSRYGDAKRLEHTGKDGAPLNLTVLDPDAVVDQIVSIATEYPQAAPKLRALLQSALDRIA